MNHHDKIAQCILTLCLIYATPALAQIEPSCVEEYEIDQKYTNIMWYASRMGYSRTIGKFDSFQGTINLNNCDVSKSSIYITIDTNSINSGVDELNRQLKSKTFFDVENYPEATFKKH